MAHSLKVTVQVEVDGVTLFSAPFQRRIQTNELFAIGPQLADVAGYNSISPTIPNVGVAIISCDKSISLKLNGSATAFTLNAGGLFVMMDGVLNAGVATNLTAQYNPGDGTVATLNGITGGT